MDADHAFYVAVAGMAIASYACRVGGFLLMGLIPITPRLEAGLRAMPIGIMTGIVAPSVVAGRPPEIAGLLVTAAVMKLTGSDLAAALAGSATVAAARWWLRLSSGA
jgi:uncharacterized membrane protein